jgi:hypothetical protein
VKKKSPSNLIIEELPAIRPRWASIKAASQFSGVARYRIFELINEGKIRSAVLKRKGLIRGRRLIDLDSLDAYISQHVTGGQQ